jgi:hypothetical protein
MVVVPSPFSSSGAPASMVVISGLLRRCDAICSLGTSQGMTPSRAECLAAVGLFSPCSYRENHSGTPLIVNGPERIAARTSRH